MSREILDNDLIEKSILEFIDMDPNRKFSKEECAGYVRYTITDSNGDGYLDVFINEGKTTIRCQGRNMDIAKECSAFIIDNAKLPATGPRTVSLAKVNKDDALAFINTLSTIEGIQTSLIDTKSPLVEKSVKYEDATGAKVTVTLYKSGTLLLQGIITKLYIEIVEHCVEVINGVPFDLFDQFIAKSSCSTQIVDPNVSSHIGNMTPIAGSKLEMMIHSSLVLINSNIILDEYSSFSFAILRALDGVMSKKLCEDGTTFKYFSEYFHFDGTNYSYQPGKNKFPTNPKLCSALLNGYKLIKECRHKTFHVDRPDPDTSLVLTREEAKDYVIKALNQISKICENW